MDCYSDQEFVVEKNTLNEDLEWIKYCKDCDEWNDEIIEEEEKEQEYKILYPTQLFPTEVRDEQMIIMKNKISLKKKIGPVKTLCKNFGKKCTFSNCRSAHTWKDVDYCSTCKINYSNNFYSGNCHRRHAKETLDNYFIRRNFKPKHYKVDEFSFKFFESPDEEFLKNLLNVSKNINVKQVNFEFVNKPITLEDYLETRQEQL